MVYEHADGFCCCDDCKVSGGRTWMHSGDEDSLESDCSYCIVRCERAQFHERALWAIALSRRAPEWGTTAHEYNYIQYENGPSRWRTKEDVARKVGKHIAHEFNPSY